MSGHELGKRVGVVVMTMILFFSSIGIMPAQASRDDIIVYVNGHKLTFDNPPLIEDGRTLVPLRTIFEAMGTSVDWDEASSTVIAVKDDVEVRITIGSNRATVNGRIVEVEVPAQVINGRTFVPLRFISDSLGSDIDWFENSRTVMVNTCNQISVKNSYNLRLEVYIFNGGDDLAMLIIDSSDGVEDTTLITAGNCSDARNIIQNLDNHGVSDIDQLIVTTPFKKSSKGIEEIYDTFDVEERIISEETNTSDAYEQFMQDNYPDFPLQPQIPDVSEFMPDLSDLIPDLSDLF